MKNIVFKISTSILTATLLFGCNNFDNLNTDPARSVIADPPSLISAVQLRLSGERETQWRSLGYYHMGVTQLISDGYTFAKGSTYSLLSDYIERMWRSDYQMIDNLILAYEQSEKDGNMRNYQAAALMMKILIFSHLTDTYGDIPYTEAGKAVYPKYDTQEFIYNDLFAQLDVAISLFDADKPFIGDLIYGGDVELWKRFANSLRLRFAMRLVNVDIARAESEARKAFNAGVFSDYSQTAYVKHANVDASSNIAEIRGNGFSQTLHFADAIPFACSTYTNYLRDNNDPRLHIMFGVYGVPKGTLISRSDSKATTESSIECTKEYMNEKGTLLGVLPAGTVFESIGALNLKTVYLKKDGIDVEVQPMFNLLQIRRELARLDAPSIYQAYSEVELWLAEAQERGWNLTTLSSQAHFSNAVKGHVDELEDILGSVKCKPTDIERYIGEIWSGQSDKMKLINMQHYVCNYFNGIEANANWRRSGWPELVPANNTDTDQELLGLIPRRMPYPLTEINYNKSNVAQHLDEGRNLWGAPVWWDSSKTRGVKLN